MGKTENRNRIASTRLALYRSIRDALDNNPDAYVNRVSWEQLMNARQAGGFQKEGAQSRPDVERNGLRLKAGVQSKIDKLAADRAEALRIKNDTSMTWLEKIQARSKAKPKALLDKNSFRKLLADSAKRKAEYNASDVGRYNNKADAQYNAVRTSNKVNKDLGRTYVGGAENFDTDTGLFYKSPDKISRDDVGIDIEAILTGGMSNNWRYNSTGEYSAANDVAGESYRSIYGDKTYRDGYAWKSSNLDSLNAGGVVNTDTLEEWVKYGQNQDLKQAQSRYGNNKYLTDTDRLDVSDMDSFMANRAELQTQYQYENVMKNAKRAGVDTSTIGTYQAFAGLPAEQKLAFQKRVDTRLEFIDKVKQGKVDQKYYAKKLKDKYSGGFSVLGAVAAIGIGIVTGGVGLAAMGAMGVTGAVAVVGGAAIGGALNASITGGDVLKGALFSGVTAGVAQAAGSLASGAGGAAMTAAETGTAGWTSPVGNLISGTAGDAYVSGLLTAGLPVTDGLASGLSGAAAGGLATLPTTGTGEWASPAGSVGEVGNSANYLDGVQNAGLPVVDNLATQTGTTITNAGLLAGGQDVVDGGSINYDTAAPETSFFDADAVGSPPESAPSGSSNAAPANNGQSDTNNAASAAGAGASIWANLRAKGSRYGNRSRGYTGEKRQPKRAEVKRKQTTAILPEYRDALDANKLLKSGV